MQRIIAEKFWQSRDRASTRRTVRLSASQGANVKCDTFQLIWVPATYLKVDILVNINVSMQATYNQMRDKNKLAINE